MPFQPSTIARLQSSGGYSLRWLLWIEAKHRETGELQALGLWSGDYDLTWNGRVYAGALGLFSVDDITSGTGTLIRSQTVQIGPLTPEVRTAIDLYQPRFAPVEIHARVEFEEDGHVDYSREFKGFIDKLPRALPGVETQPVASLDLVSSARLGTRAPHLKKSDTSQKRRDPDDDFRQYGSIAGVVPVWWGEGRAAYTKANSAYDVAPISRGGWG